MLLEEWLLELAAIAQEQSVLQKELAFEIGMGLSESNAVSLGAISATATQQHKKVVASLVAGSSPLVSS